MVINSEPWIKTVQDSDEDNNHDPFYPAIETRYMDENWNLEDRVTSLEKIIKTHSIEIEKLKKQLQNYRNIDISRITDVDFWLTEEDDVWDTL